MDKILSVHIATHTSSPGRYIARYTSEFLGAIYSVEFSNSVAGAVSLYHFVEMLKTRYPAAQIRFHLPRDQNHKPAPAIQDAFAMHQAT